MRRIRKTAVKAPSQPTEEKKTLGGFLSKNEPSSPRKMGGSASVAGDQIAVSKESSLTGEVYVRADGKKGKAVVRTWCLLCCLQFFLQIFLRALSVRRVKKAASSNASVSGASAAAPGDNVEIITKPDGTKVRRIRKTKPKPVDDAGALSGFLELQPKAAPRGGGATVAGDRVASNEIMDGKENGVPQSPLKSKESLDGFLGKMDSKPRKIGGSASVAGDQIAVSKDSSLTGEVYVRADGKKGTFTALEMNSICACSVPVVLPFLLVFRG